MIKKHTFNILLYNIQSHNKISWLWWLPLYLLSIGAFSQDVDQNWVKTIAYKTVTSTPVATPTATQAKVSVTYLDGLGRTTMKIANRQSNSGKDIVQPVVYDSFGRATKNYLPYIAGTGTMAFDANAVNNVAASYSEFANQNLYAETLYEPSPLNRVLKQAAPGDSTSWAMGSGHEIKYKYTTNSSSDNVKKYSVNSTFNLVDNGYYPVDQLYKTIVYNENSAATPTTETENATITFSNDKGQVVLSRTYAIDSGLSTTVAHDTYTVYDLYDNVALVSPPLTSATLLSGIATTTAQDEMYQYKYDIYNRLIEKKEPGKNWQFVVYDRLNRIVANGPAVTPFGGLETETGWMVSFYDNLNRPCYSGWYSQTAITSASRNTLQVTFNGAIANVTKTTSGTIDGLTVFYSSTSVPAAFKLLSVNYYDTYNYPNAPTSFADVELQKVYYNTTVLPRGLPTGSWVRTMTAATTTIIGETSYILYDYRARPILARSTNYLGGYTQVKTKVDFSGKTNYTKTEHQRTNITTTLITTVNNFTYSEQDRLLTQTKKVNNDAVQLLTANTYNERGQLLNKKVGGTDITTATYFQKVDYTYNIRGWLKGINDDATNNLILNTTEKDLFGFKINYNTVENKTNYTGKELYNGNISETYWRCSSDNNLRKYGYYYDNLDRLEQAVYQKPEFNTAVTNMYNESISYDKNGNILTLRRNGDYDADTMPIAIDILNYYYKPNSNQLLRVDDVSSSGSNTMGFSNGTNIDDDYTYDASGNMIADKNKSTRVTSTNKPTLSNIKYNHLNLPVEIFFATTKKINYLYSASGKKLKKTVTSGTSVTVTDYIDGYQYITVGSTAAVLQYFPTAEGYVNYDAGVYKYVYNYTDNVGNVRVSYTSDASGQVVILEENHYYPYGLKHSSYNVTTMVIKGGGVGPSIYNPYKYKFNGQEYQDELSLNLYDMDMRDYDPAIARWTGIDPVTHYSQSTYNAFDGNPVFWADPSGADAYGGHTNSSSNSPFAGGNAAVSNTGAWSSNAGNYRDLLGYTTGVVGASAWGDGNNGSVMDLSTKTYYGAEAANVLRGFGSTWVEGSVTRDGSGSMLDTVNLGYWVKNSSGGAGMDNGFGMPVNTSARSDTFRPGSAKIAEVAGNLIGTFDLAHQSSWANWVRGGTPALQSVSNGLKIAGNTIGAIGIGIETYQYANGQITGLELGVDTLISGAAIVTSIFAAPVVATGFAVGALVYFGGKAIYEYSSGTTMFTKPK